MTRKEEIDRIYGVLAKEYDNYIKAIRLYDAGWRKQIEAEWVPIITVDKKFGVPMIVGFNCSNCQTKQEVPTNYCSFCGVKMKAKEK